MEIETQDNNQDQTTDASPDKATETDAAEADKTKADPSLASETEDKSGDEAEGGKDQEQDKGEKAPELPESADQYDLTIPEDIGLKDANGDPIQFADDDPLAKEFRDFAFEKKLDQDAVKGFVKLYAKAIKDSAEQTSAAQAEKINEIRNAEMEKLKTTGADGKEISPGTRIENLKNSVNTVLGDGAFKKLFAPDLISARLVVGIEQLVAKAQETAGKGQENDSLDGLRGEARLKALRNQS